MTTPVLSHYGAVMVPQCNRDIPCTQSTYNHLLPGGSDRAVLSPRAWFQSSPGPEESELAMSLVGFKFHLPYPIPPIPSHHHLQTASDTIHFYLLHPLKQNLVPSV